MLEYYRAKWRLRKLIRYWSEYRDLVVQSVGSREITVAVENRFLEIKADMAKLLQLLEEAAPSSMAAEARREIGAMTNLLKSHIKLSNDAATEQWVREEFSRIWHDHFIFLNRLTGVRLGHKRAANPRASAAVPESGSKKWLPRSLAAKRRLHFAATVLVLAVVVIGVVQGFGVDRLASGRFVVQNQSSVGQALESVLNAGNGAAMNVVRFFDPVVAAYGQTWTLVLLGSLLLGGFLWFFARG